jgi:hypothetical protein
MVKNHDGNSKIFAKRKATATILREQLGNKWQERIPTELKSAGELCSFLLILLCLRTARMSRLDLIEFEQCSRHTR